MNILLTGSSGTIGSRLFERLSELGYCVTGVDRKQNKWIPSLNKKTINVNLLVQEELAKMPANIDLIIHLAANARVYDLINNPKLALENIITTFNILEFARKNGLTKIIFSSSREIYGNLTEENSMTEDKARVENCENPYSASKVAGEALIRAYEKVYGIDYAIARYSNVYGMYDDSDRVIPLWIKQALNNIDLTVFGKDKIIDFTYIDDVINGTVKIIEYFDEIKGETFNIAYGEGIKLSFIAHEIKKILGSRSKIIINKNRSGEIQKFIADISKAKKLLDYYPDTGIGEGLMKAVEWYKKTLVL